MLKNIFTDSPYRDDINEAILLLKEDRTVQHLKEKWWITNNIRIGADGEPVNCTKEKEINVDTPELDMGNVVGIFIVLAAGFGIGLFIGILHFLWHVRKVSISQKVNQLLIIMKKLCSLLLCAKAFHGYAQPILWVFSLHPFHTRPKNSGS